MPRFRFFYLLLYEKKCVISMIMTVFFDIVGTLVSFKTHKLPDSTVRALDLLREKGIKVFLATGRQLHTINSLGTQEFDGYVT